MAKRKPKKKAVEKEPKFQLGSSAAREIIAIILITLAIFMLIALFGFAGVLGTWVLMFVRFFIGLSSLLLPFALIVVAWVLFKPEDFEFKLNNLIGLMGFFAFLSGIFQFALAPSVVSIDRVGDYGGVVGLGLYAIMSPILNRPVAIFILIAFLLISLVIAANARLKELVQKFFSLFMKQKPEGEIAINDNTLQINGNVLPIKGTIGERGPAKETKEEGALTVRTDPDWKYPPYDLLKEGGSSADPGNVKANAATIQKTLAEFDINVAMEGVNIGPTVSQYTLKPDSNVKLSKITALDRNLALALAAHSIRIEAPIPGQSAVGIEVPNKKAAIVRMRGLINSEEMNEMHSKLAFVLGKDVSGEITVADLAKMPHLIIAGSTGTGKSVMINSLITSLLYRNSPSELKLILVDPKMVEMTSYNDIPHLLTPVITETDKTISALKWSVAEMERRYKLISEHGKKGIADFNKANEADQMPYIVILIDELNDLMMMSAKEVEAMIVRLAQKGRAAGIHLILATQRPDVNTITGTIKANVSARIAFMTASQIDSRTILEGAGAEKLLGNGDMLFKLPTFPKPRRIQGVFVSDEEVGKLTDWLRAAGKPLYNDEVLTQQVRTASGAIGGGGGSSDADEAMIAPAVEVILQRGRASTSDLQRRLGLGYARAARLIDLLEERGIVGPPNGSKPREVLISSMAEISGEDPGEQ
ncbi:DNA translocase FtsK 4TM domain-containing protein [bacterium]|nr:DNA translocase FtsK 4TM domain-containing protein [bacterium]